MKSREPITYIIVVFMLMNVLQCSFMSASEPKNFITIVYNNVPGDTTAGIEAGAGFGAFILFNEKTILFDVGAEASILFNNIEKLGLNAKQVDAIVISHNHWDHVYGLPGALAYAQDDLKVYVPASSEEAILDQNPRAIIIPIDEPTQMFPNIWSTGSIETVYGNRSFAEQALILDGDDGLYILTGCAHPGILNIVERTRKLFPEKSIMLVAGGFHLVDHTEQEVREISAALKQLGVKKIAPSHCTGRLAMEIFKQEWHEYYVRLYLGHTYRF